MGKRFGKNLSFLPQGKKGNEGDFSNKKIWKIFFLQCTIFIFAASCVASKFAAEYMSEYGLFSLPCITALFLYGTFTVAYAVAWQYNLEKFELSFLYTNRSFYMIWTQLFAVLIFKDRLYLNNAAGLVLIFMGVWVNAKDA